MLILVYLLIAVLVTFAATHFGHLGLWLAVLLGLVVAVIVALLVERRVP